MAEAIVGVALETLSSLIQKELFSFLGVDAEMRRLSSLLTTINAVLEDAEEKQITDKVLKNWLRKLRDEAHLLDDILDECSTYALSLEYQHKLQASCFCSFKPCHVMFRYKMAKKLNDISQRLDEISAERSKFHLRERVHEERRNGVMEWRETTSNISQPHFYGRDAEKQKIVDFLVGGVSDLEDLSVYPIVGIGGLGKTTLAQRVYHDERVIHHSELRLWVCVSDDFSLTRLLKAIIESAGHTCGYSSLEPLQKQVKELLGRKRYLLVLDDVWNDDKDKWNDLKSVLACGSKGSSILVTTRLPNVAQIPGTIDPLHLSFLSEDDCWELFKQLAFGPLNKERVELVAIGKEIVKKCKGVPLAAKTLGSLLGSCSDEKDWIRINENEIWNLPQEKHKEKSIMPALRLSYLNLSAKLRQCFAYLAVFPKDVSMSKKKLIELWMANGFISTIEGRDAEDDGDRVWNELNSKSFFEDVKSEDDNFYNEYDDDTRFKMHDLFHDLAQFVMEEECCSKRFESSPPGERTLHLSIDGVGPFDEQWSYHFHKVKLLKSLIILRNHEAITSSDIFLKCYSLRALDLIKLEEAPSSIHQLKHLRYLNLSRGDFSRLPDSICRLWNLLILNLTYCFSLQKLPNQLKCLKSLRHLHLKHCWSLSRLAPEMGRLTCLKTLDTYIVGMKKGFFLEEIGNLKLEGRLHIKHLERVTSEMDAKKANLADKRLNKLELSWEREEPSRLQQNEEEILKVLQPHVQLETLVIRGYDGTQLPQWMGDPMRKDLSCLELHYCRNVVGISLVAKLPSLKRLTLSNMHEVTSFPDDMLGGLKNLEELHISSLSKLEALATGLANLNVLEELTIRECDILETITEEVLRGLRSLKTFTINHLPKFKLCAGFRHLVALQHLTIDECPEVEDMHDGLQHLTTLRWLNLYHLPNLASLPHWLGNLSSLEELFIYNCPKLTSLPMSIQSLINLTSLKIWGCPELGKRCKDETGEDWHKIAHVPLRSIRDAYPFYC